ncbi:MAG TPA: hypothetical protein VFQ13_25090 [Anaerolineales bacterium]|nr:hypothetical protein [Anaerolineales bacterium]
MRTIWILLIGLLSLALAGCAASQTVAKDSPTLASKDVTSLVTTAVATSTVITTSGWRSYDNTQAGYSAEYPADWTVNESIGTNGEFVTTFMAPDNAQGLAVTVLKGETAAEEIPDMPNTRCQPVKISELPGQHCLDTVASSISTTFSGNNKQFAIVAIGKKPDQTIYQTFLENFTVTP